MDSCAFVFAALCLAVSAAPPPQLHQLQQINALDYYLDHPELHNYYNQQHQQQKQGNVRNQGERLETLEPDSEVELIPGAQPPQQPPQQPPVAPNLPGLAPGQRVFIVHMPIPGYRPGTIGGYQPVYIVAAAPQQGNPGFPGNGYQNAVLLNPANQGVAHSGYQGGVQGGYPGIVQGSHPGLVQGGHPGLVQGATPLLFGVPQNPYYQDPGVAYHQAGPSGLRLAPEGNQGPVRLAQLVNLRSPASAAARPQASEASSSETKQQSQPIIESKEGTEEPRRNARPTPVHAQARIKA